VPTEYDRKVPSLEKRVLQRGGPETFSRGRAPKTPSLVSPRLGFHTFRFNVKFASFARLVGVTVSAWPDVLRQ
jgi:hypothetical protein